MCKFYTFLGEGNHLRCCVFEGKLSKMWKHWIICWKKKEYKIQPAPYRHTCYLYSGCEIFSNDCEDCTTGKVDCDICKFENMLPDGSCGRDFTHCFLQIKRHNLGFISTLLFRVTFLWGSLDSVWKPLLHEPQQQRAWLWKYRKLQVSEFLKWNNPLILGSCRWAIFWMEQSNYFTQEWVFIFGRDACQHPQRGGEWVYFQFDSTSSSVLSSNLDWSIPGKLWRLWMGWSFSLGLSELGWR